MIPENWNLADSFAKIMSNITVQALIPPVGFIPRSLLRLLNKNPCRIPRPLAAGSFIAGAIGKGMEGN
jgi:hypothetical protein